MLDCPYPLRCAGFRGEHNIRHVPRHTAKTLLKEVVVVPSLRIRSLVMIALAPMCAYAQNITGSIVGQVADPSGSAVPGAAIAAKNMDTGSTAQTTTDTSGSYSLPNLLAGDYEISVRKAGFQALTVSRLPLLSAQTLRQDVTLQVGAVQQSIEAAGHAVLSRTDSQTLGSSLGARQAADLPLAGRSIDSLLAMAPGVET